MADEVRATSKWLPSLGRLKMVPWFGLLGAAAVVAPFVLNSFRQNRRFDEDALPPMPKALADLPLVLDFTPAGQPIAQGMPQGMPVAQGMPGDTLMGQQMVEGPIAQKIKMQRAGIVAGPDMASPNITTPAGVSVIDGKPVTDLDNRHVRNLHKDASSPSFDIAG